MTLPFVLDNQQHRLAALPDAETQGLEKRLAGIL